MGIVTIVINFNSKRIKRTVWLSTFPPQVNSRRNRHLLSNPNLILVVSRTTDDLVPRHFSAVQHSMFIVFCPQRFWALKWAEKLPKTIKILFCVIIYQTEFNDIRWSSSSKPVHKTVQGLGFLRIEFNLPNINYINCKSYLAAI